MARHGMHYINDNEYYTPREFVNLFGKFDYDPATTKEKAMDFGIDNYDTIDTDGLKSDWTRYKRIWINPPFTRKYEFMAKAAETYKISRNDIYILFPIEFLTTKIFYGLPTKGKLYIPNGRVSFQSGLGKQVKSPAFGSVVMKVQDQMDVEFFCKNSSVSLV